MKSDKPASGIGRPHVAQPNDEETEALREAREEQKDQAAIDARKSVDSNKVASMLGGTWYITDHTWPYFRSDDRQMSVTEFYPDLNIAIDKFFNFGPHEERLTKEKKRLLNANGIRYAYLEPMKSLGDIGPDLEDQIEIVKKSVK
jgi:hypothetical protein